MGQIRRRARRIDLEVQMKIEELAREGGGAKQIADALANSVSPDKVPTAKTIQRVIRDVVQLDTSGSWRLADEDTDSKDAFFLLPVLAQHGTLTRAEAAWVVRLRRAMPKLPGVVALFLARVYRSWEYQRRSTDALDLALALNYCRRSDEKDAVFERRQGELLASHGQAGQDALQIVRRAEQLARAEYLGFEVRLLGKSRSLNDEKDGKRIKRTREEATGKLEVRRAPRRQRERERRPGRGATRSAGGEAVAE